MQSIAIGAGPVRPPDITQTQYLTAALGGLGDDGAFDSPWFFDPGVVDPGGVAVIGQDTLMTIALPDGSGDAVVASVGDDQTIYLADGRFITSDGLNIIDPAAGSVSWQDVFGNWHTDASGSISVVDPSTGQPTTFLDQLTKILQSGAALTTTVRQIFGGTTPAQRPVHAGGSQWRLPNGQIVTGTKLPDGRYQLPDGTIVAAPAGGIGMGTLAVLGIVGLAAFGFMRKK